MEIYNEVGYDLLDPGREVAGLDDLPKVQAMEGEEGKVHLRNLALHKAASQEEALNLVSPAASLLQIPKHLPPLLASTWLQQICMLASLTLEAD